MKKAKLRQGQKKILNVKDNLRKYVILSVTEQKENKKKREKLQQKDVNFASLFGDSQIQVYVNFFHTAMFKGSQTLM